MKNLQNNQEKLNLIAPINSLGYGQVGKNIALELKEHLECELSLFPIGEMSGILTTEEFKIKDLINNARTPDFDAPCIRLWHQHDMSQFVGKGLKIGFPIFELDRFTEVELHHLNHLDRVYVCSEWAKGVIVKETNKEEKDVKVIPLGAETYGIKSAPISKTTKFFTCGKWEIRKGHDALATAFNEAFTSEDNVELHMMCDNPFLTNAQHYEWRSRYTDSSLGHKVRFIPRVQTHKEVISIMASMDCGVFISRAEGWNLELLEMMAIGKSVIATNYSGHTEFCNNKNSLLVDIDKKETANDGVWFHGQGEWAKLGTNQISQIANHMIDFHTLKENQYSFTNNAGIATGRKFTWKNTAQEIINDIKNIGSI